MSKKSSSRSKIHPYLILSNWKPGGVCNFWSDRSPATQAIYNEALTDQMNRERNLVVFQDNIQR